MIIIKVTTIYLHYLSIDKYIKYLIFVYLGVSNLMFILLNINLEKNNYKFTSF